jgi:HEAT repeat protein
VPFVPQLTAMLRRPERAESHADIIELLADLIPHGVEVLSAFRDALRQAIAGDVYGGRGTSAVARAAIARLAALGPAAAPAIPDIVRADQTFRGDPRGDLREEVLDAYGQIGGAAVPNTRAALADPVWKIRLAAIEALSATGDTSAETVAALRAAETDAAKKVRTRAAAVLKTMEARNGKRT